MKDYIIIKNQKKLYFFYKIYKKIPIYEMYLVRLKKKSIFKFFPIKSIVLYGSWIFKLHKKKAIIIFETMYSTKIGKFIKRVNPKCKVILFYWNTIADRTRKSYLKDPNIDEFYTFDKMDAKKYGIKYNSQFYSNEIELPKNDIKYDVFFIGRDKGRKNELLSLEKKLSKLGLKTKFIIVSDERNFISYQEYLNILSQSRVILDYVTSYQTGLSLRCMESIFFSKKIITNNPYIKDYDFYDKDNIFILNKRSNIKQLNKFINGEFKSIDKDIIDEYDYLSWIERFNV